MKILVHGSTGRMGKILCELLAANNGLELAARVSPEEIADPGACVYTSLDEVSCDVDGVIDFSHHTAIGSLMDFCMAKNLPVVVATTGHTPEEKAIIAEAAKKPILRLWKSTTTRNWMFPVVPHFFWHTGCRKC